MLSCLLFLLRDSKIPARQEQAGPPRMRFYGSGLASLPSWLWIMNTGWLCSMRSEIFLQMKFIHFQDFPIKQAVFLPRPLAPKNQLLIQPLLLFPEWYFAQNVKLRSLNFKSISLKMLFSFAATFFSSFCCHFELIFSS